MEYFNWVWLSSKDIKKGKEVKGRKEKKEKGKEKRKEWKWGGEENPTELKKITYPPHSATLTC